MSFNPLEVGQKAARYRACLQVNVLRSTLPPKLPVAPRCLFDVLKDAAVNFEILSRFESNVEALRELVAAIRYQKEKNVQSLLKSPVGPLVSRLFPQFKYDGSSEQSIAITESPEGEIHLNVTVDSFAKAALVFRSFSRLKLFSRHHELLLEGALINLVSVSEWLFHDLFTEFLRFTPARSAMKDA